MKLFNSLTKGKGVNVIYDPVGGDLFDQSLRCISWEGRILVIGFASGRIPEISVNRLLLKIFRSMAFLWGLQVPQPFSYRQRHSENY